ncbi:polyprenyl synthetase family protein [Amnibacterium kyonggiense]|uniref:Geranylgeranyl diphosphate synthase type II n=1 Tax=Amnibacterium kyonggiense TaxID=595671 RepID=A0A4R7FR31_9MICO|nr:polyprenyl synthetase family protein [Amnibacterium kyonggiense]TDS80275.1 geranylgeranyl diphosphate synthase type II [Amnibacterium kyonggiense]
MSTAAPLARTAQVPARPTTPDLQHVVDALHRHIDVAAAATPAAARLWSEVRRASSGGKLVRPRLLVTAHRALGGADATAEARAAAGFELLHTAFLIHDDVIDHDWTRRGEANVAATFRAAALARGRRPDAAEHLGVSAAIIAGDLAVAGAVQLVGGASDDAATSARLAAIVAEAVSATAAGELLDVELAAADGPDLDTVLAMYEAKTSVYTFCAPLRAGAALAGADADVLAALDRAGRALGVAYQITDDLLGLFGDPAVVGKSTVSDAREGKRTVLAALLAERGIDPRVDRMPPEAAAARLRDLVERSGARAAAIDLAAAHTFAARDALGGVPTELGRALQHLLTELTDRDL